MTHFTATLEVTRTETPPVPTPSSGYQDRRIQTPAPDARREVQEVARLVLRADTLDGLLARVADHAALLNEGSGK